MLSLQKFPTDLKTILKTLEVTPDNGSLRSDAVMKVAIMSVAPITVLWSVGNQYITGSEWSLSLSLRTNFWQWFLLFLIISSLEKFVFE